jgi:pimeloyl-ACP methyl ester carboxylesterase
MIVFAHGWNSDPSVYAPLLQEWAAAGYLVAAPVFPDSSDTLPGTPVSDFPDETRDLTFVITALLANRSLSIDPARIAVAGHSDGGSDVALLALNPAYADHRIRAYLSLSSEMPAGVAGPWGAPTPGALLVVVGTADQYGLLPRSTSVYETAAMVKALLTVAGGDHLGPFVGTSAQAQSVRAETVRFLQAALASGTVTAAALGAALAPPPDASLTVTTGSG